MTEAAKISVGIEAELSKLQGQLSQAKNMIAKETEAMGRVAEKANIAERMFKMAQATFALRIVGHSIQSVASAMKAIRSDDWRVFVDEVERLPFGLGAVAGGVRQIYDELSGFNVQMEKIDLALSNAEKMTSHKAKQSEMLLRIEEERANNMAARQASPFNRIDLEHEADLNRADRFRVANQQTYGYLADVMAEEMMTGADIQRNKKRQAETAKIEKELADQAEKAAAREASSRYLKWLRPQEDRLASLAEEEGMLSGRRFGSESDYIKSSETALGTFKSGDSNAAAKNMREQLQTQKRLVEIANEQKDILEDIRSISELGGWK